MNDDAMNIFLRGLVVDEHDPGDCTPQCGNARADIDGNCRELDAYLEIIFGRPFCSGRMVLSSLELEELDELVNPDAEMSPWILFVDTKNFQDPYLRTLGFLWKASSWTASQLSSTGSRYPLAFGSLHMSVDIEEFLILLM